ncbi:MAG TPA: HigA family addiction module antitoxin [Thermoanaerobaculia bacterium]|nr:HigA family addiction module antitoxin [Thermoanaerobaculia bacterium]
MAEQHVNEYKPESVSLPGETLQEVLDERQITQAELAERMGRPKKTINEIVQGKAALTPETALQLERVLGVPAGFWNNLERNYREHEARREEEERLASSGEWMRKIPVRKMVELEWIDRHADPVGQARELLNFFGIASPERWRDVFELPQASYRHTASFESETGSLAAWLRKGALEGQEIDCASFDRDRFKAVLVEARGITREPPEVFAKALVERCASAGVAVAFVPELPGCRANGATRWLSPRKALIQLSLRYRWADVFWFSFFHEAAHVLLHGKREVFIEGGDGAPGEAVEQKEREADRFAARLLIPPGELDRLRPRGGAKGISKARVRAFADESGIHPGIVVGRLQHEGWLPHTHLNGLRTRLAWG